METAGGLQGEGRWQERLTGELKPTGPGSRHRLSDFAAASAKKVEWAFFEDPTLERTSIRALKGR